MSHVTLHRGNQGDEVILLQTALNRVGAMLVADGDFGAGTERGVRYAQDQANQNVTGIADQTLWDWLDQQPDPFPALATNGIAFIAAEETGGLAFYKAVTRWPHFPGLSSGITIGVGYDLRFNTEADFRLLWGDHLPAPIIDALSEDIGKPGSQERVDELRAMGVEVPFKAAWPVFVEKTLPRFYDQTLSIYPSLASLPELCRSVLVSIVFNRGSSLSGPGRVEMRAIRDLLEAAVTADDLQLKIHKLVEVEDQIVQMKRLWNPGSGVFKRRQAEANLWRQGMRHVGTV